MMNMLCNHYTTVTDFSDAGYTKVKKVRKTQIALTGRPGGPAGPKGPVPPGIPYDKTRDTSDMRIVYILGITFQN